MMTDSVARVTSLANPRCPSCGQKARGHGLRFREVAWRLGITTVAGHRYRCRAGHTWVNYPGGVVPGRKLHSRLIEELRQLIQVHPEWGNKRLRRALGGTVSEATVWRLRRDLGGLRRSREIS